MSSQGAALIIITIKNHAKSFFLLLIHKIYCLERCSRFIMVNMGIRCPVYHDEPRTTF